MQGSVIRDGRDVAVSYYFWSGHNNKESFSDFVEKHIFADNSLFPGGWHHHVNSWLEHQCDEKMLIVRYEALVHSSVSELQRISKFVDLHRSDTAIETAIRRSSLTVQQADFRNYKPFEEKKVGVKGAPGKWMEFFDDELNDYFWQVAGDIMEKFGYKYKKGNESS